MSLTVAWMLTAAIIGGVMGYTVAPGDTLSAVAAQFGAYPATIAADNRLDPKRPLEVGRQLHIDNRHIVPADIADGEVVVNIPQRMLFYREADRILAYPIAVGRTTWRTPAGSFEVVRMDQDPAWHVPESIRAESERSGKLLPRVVPPGPRNPLGGFWIGLSLSSIGIHGTTLPSSIYQAATHGCVRLQADDIADLFSRVHVGTRGRIIYEPVLLARDGSDVFVEVHDDIYRRMPGTAREQARELAVSLGVSRRIDWAAADLETDRRGGVARPIGLKSEPVP
jgi:L,D-transpeptidase ErfK/SrfK